MHIGSHVTHRHSPGVFVIVALGYSPAGIPNFEVLDTATARRTWLYRDDCTSVSA